MHSSIVLQICYARAVFPKTASGYSSAENMLLSFLSTKTRGKKPLFVKINVQVFIYTGMTLLCGMPFNKIIA